MHNVEIKINDKTGDKELYLFGDFQASRKASVDDFKVIVPYAIECAVKIGEDKKVKEVLQVLGLQR